MSKKNYLQEYCQKKKISMPVYDSISRGPHHTLEWSCNITLNNTTISTTKYETSKIAAEQQAAGLMLKFIKKNKRSDVGSPTVIEKFATQTLSVDIPEKSIDVVDIFRRTVSLPNEHITSDPISLPNENIIISSEQNLKSIQNIYIIDLENKPCLNNKIDKPDSLYIGFLNMIHHSVNKYGTWNKCVTDNIKEEVIRSNNLKILYLIEGGVSDLVDHFMTALIYPLIVFIMQVNIRPTINIISGDHACWCTRICLEKILKWNNLLDIKIKNSTTI